MGETCTNTLQARERRWVKSFVVLFVVVGLIAVAAPSDATQVASQSIILGTTGNGPYGIVVDAAGNIYTTNWGLDNVSKITPDGVSTILGTTGRRPSGIVIDAAGNIYTANVGSNNVSKITPDGVSTILGTTGRTPFGIAIDAVGNIYTANHNSDNVSMITPTPSTKKPGAKKTTIACKKGKVVKKVTALKPVCPKGYKKA